MNKKGVSLKLIFVCVFVVLLACVFAAETAGLIDFNETAAKIPVVKTLLKPTSEENGANLPAVSVIETENESLRAEKKQLEEKISNYDIEKNAMQEEISTLKLEIAALTADKEAREREAIQIEQMALYYKEMKAEAVVKIMDNLDDDTVVNILPLLEKSHAAKILSLMEPHRAALLTRILLGSDLKGGDKNDV